MLTLLFSAFAFASPLLFFGCEADDFDATPPTRLRSCRYLAVTFISDRGSTSAGLLKSGILALLPPAAEPVDILAASCVVNASEAAVNKEF